MTGTATRLRSARWSVWSTVAHLVVTEADALPRARRIVEAQISATDAAASRFRADSEISRLAVRTASRRDAGGVTVSPVLADLVRVALDAAATTGGDVDPTLGNDLVELGYRSSLARAVPGDVAARPGSRHSPRVVPVHRPSWRDLQLSGRTLMLPAGVLLDLGATAKARTADLAAEAIAAELGCGALVNLGGDLRVAGPQPADGWQVEVQDGPGQPASRVRLDGADAVATSSTLHRTWRQGSRWRHHILDPELRTPAAPTWRTVSVAAATCVRANTFSTAAVVRGTGAPALLAGAGVAARLVGHDGSVTLLGGWPA